MIYLLKILFYVKYKKLLFGLINYLYVYLNWTENLKIIEYENILLLELNNYSLFYHQYYPYICIDVNKL